MEPLNEADGLSVDLHERGIDESQAADLRRRLALFQEDWNRPEMTACDALPRFGMARLQ